MQERVLASLFLCSKEYNELLQLVKPQWNEGVSLSFPEKWQIASHDFPVNTIFPWIDQLSPGIDFERFTESFFTQPDLFLRIRPGKKESVKRKLQQASIGFESLSETCLALPNTSKVDQFIEMDKEAVVQDYSSQRVGEFLLQARPSERVWECCAASGGKSILAKDILGKIDLTVSDLRESILVNLKKRFASAGINTYKVFKADLSGPGKITDPGLFDLVIADLPCTGSGTWSRTPEQLYYFDSEKIKEYAALQRKILSRVVTQMAPDGYLLYITCSVFKQENEEQVDFMKDNLQLQLLRMEILKGYDKKADTLFGALLQKSL